MSEVKTDPSSLRELARRYDDIPEWADEVCETLLALAVRDEIALHTATGIAVAMAKHYPENDVWEPATEIVGLLFQISNAASGLTRAAQPAMPQAVLDAMLDAAAGGMGIVRIDPADFFVSAGDDKEAKASSSEPHT